MRINLPQTPLHSAFSRKFGFYFVFRLGSFAQRIRPFCRRGCCCIPQGRSVARVGLAEERTEEFQKCARVSQPAFVNRQNSADTDPPRLHKYFRHKRCARLSIFP